jgi:hypothetical protein
MARKVYLLLIPVAVCSLAAAAAAAAEKREITDPAEAKADPDFSVQGEYLGEFLRDDGTTAKAGVQVIARGGGKFEVVGLPGGLPGAGWKRGDPSYRTQGELKDGTLTFKTDQGETMLLKIADGQMTLLNAEGKKLLTAKRIERKSPTLGAKPPEGALVIFDGKNLDMFEPSRGLRSHLTEQKTVTGDVTTKPLPENYRLHLEFRLSWMPQALGQARSNSGVYLHDCYELQVLDSFGLEGKDNECGGFYQLKAPDVNMCLPPLVWQTYDIDFTAPKFEGNKKVADARVTVRQNGVVIHDNLDLRRLTPGGKTTEGPGPRGIHLQGHGCHVQYRNIWLQAK